MAGLLDSLDTLLGSADLDVQVSVQAGDLGAVQGAVQALIDGPQSVLDLEGAIGALPTPPGLDGLGELATRLGGLEVPSVDSPGGDLAGPLAPILTPLTGLSATLEVSGTVQITAAFDLVRELLRLTTGRVFGGASGMPEGDAAASFELPDVEELRASLAQATGIVDGLGPRLDAARVLELLRQTAGGFERPLLRFPPIPLLDEIMESLATLATWQSLTPEQLSAQLAGTVGMAAELLDTPRQRVALPVLAAAGTVAAADATLSRAESELAEVFARLRPKVLAGSGKPSATELRRVEAQAAALAALAAACDPKTSPLAAVDRLPKELTRTLLGALRALQPAFDVAPIAVRVQGWIADLPAADADTFAELITAIDDFDLSALTDPMTAVRTAVEDAVAEVEGARDQVRVALEDLLRPVADALDAALAAAGFDAIRQALEDLPAAIQSFVSDDIQPNLESVRQGIGDAVDAVSGAADSFDPEALIAPIKDAVEEAADLLGTDEVASAFAEVEQALADAIGALESFDLAPAADESIALIGDIEATISGIDPASIPEAAQPLLCQAVEVVTDVDFTAEVAGPIEDGIEQAVSAGPGVVLGALEESMDEVRGRLEAFNPSRVIGDALDAPFEQLLATLREFQPSDLLGRLQEALDGVASRLGVLDVGVVVDPLVGLHGEIRGQVEALRPSNLLRPVEEAIAAAVEQVFAASGIDSVFDGLAEVLELVASWTGLLTDARDLLRRAADLVSEPGDATAAVAAMADDALDRLDSVDLGRLELSFQAAGAAFARNERNALAGELAGALQAAGEAGPSALGSAATQRLGALIEAFPLAELRAHGTAGSRRRLIAALESLAASSARLTAADAPWDTLGPRLVEAAGSLQEDLLDYHNVMHLQCGGICAQLTTPPASIAELKATVGAALVDGLTQPVTTVLLAFGAFAPYLELLARGLSDILDAFQRQVDAIAGAGGVGGTVEALEEAADLLREIDLAPITAPLDALFGRVESALDAIDPEPLRAALEAARDAVAGLIQLSTLIDPADTEALDAAYAGALEKIAGLAPGALVAEVLDPVYADLLGDILPVLELPGRLRLMVEAAGRGLGEEAVRELARIEAAFDQMLGAIPCGPGGFSISGSVDVNVSASVG